MILSDDEDSDDEGTFNQSTRSNLFFPFISDTLVVTSNGKNVQADLFEKAHDLWERATDKAEEVYDDRIASEAPVSFADFVLGDIRKRLLSSSMFSKDLIEPILDYLIKSEMLETACPTLSDLNLTGQYKDH